MCVFEFTIFGLAVFRYIILFAGTFDSGVGDSVVGFDGGEWIVANLCGCIRHSIQKR